MKKIYFLAGLAAMTLASCSNSDEPEAQFKAPETAQAQQMPIGFDAYIQRGLTRTVTDAPLLQDKGFGVFAYYTNNDDYDGQSIPNFMWNQMVSTASWTYEPVKYWPNEYGESAEAEETDRISFFAYGPYQAATATTGKATGTPTAPTKNIIGFTRNNAVGDPLVKYVVDFVPSTSVDLVWGRKPAAGGSDNFNFYDGTSLLSAETEGLPWLNIKRPKYNTNEKVKFVFDHALASLNVTVDHYADNADYATGKAVTGDTRIFIRSISFSGIASQGALNLNNNETTTITAGKIGKALWMGINGDELTTGDNLVLNDGRKDGKEGNSAASNEKFAVMNSKLTQVGDYADYNTTDKLKISDDYPGVTNTETNLFASATSTDPIYVIPTGEPVKVTIAYDVETYDANLSTFLSDGKTHGSSISNVITKEIEVGGNSLILQNGKKYIIKLHLGMNSVKFDAAVTEWDTDVNASADLPKN